MNNDGYSLGTQRNVLGGSEISEIIVALQSYNIGNKINFANGFTVPKENLIKEEYSLSLNRYKKNEAEINEYEDSKTIIQRLKKRQNEYIEMLKTIEEN